MTLPRRLLRRPAAVAALLLASLVVPPARTEGPPPDPASPSTGAEAVTEPADTIEDQIVVTAGRTEQLLRDVPAKVTVLDRAEIDEIPARAPDDLLRLIPSLNLQRPGSSRAISLASQAVSYRGMGGTSASRTLVLVDGVPLNEPFSGWIAWSRVPTPALDRVEVVPAGAAGAWGNLALGGVVQLITRRPSPGTFGTELGWGSRGTLEATVNASDVRGAAAYSAFASYYATDGFSDVPAAIRGPADTTNDSRSTVFDARLELAASSRSLWTFQAGRYDDDRERGDVISHDDLTISSFRTALDRIDHRGGQWQGNVFLLDREGASPRGSFNSDRSAVRPRRDQFSNPATSIGAGVSWRAPSSGDGRFAAGIDGLWTDSEINEDGSWSVDRFTQRSRSAGQQQLAGAFVQTSRPLSDRIVLTGGLRIDHWSSRDGLYRTFDIATGDLLYEDRFASNSRWIASPNLGLVFRPDPRVGLRAALFQAFRAPTPSEMYKSSPTSRNFIAGNADLDPERIRLGVELGLDLTPRPGATLRLTGFWNEVADAITEVTVGVAGDAAVVIPPCGEVSARGNCRQRRNLGLLRARGVELDGELRPSDAWRLRASYTYTDSRILDSPTERSLEGLRLPNIPRHQGAAQAVWAAPFGVSATAQLRYQGVRFDDDRNTLPLADAWIADLRVARRFGASLELSVEAQNLFDSTVEVARNSDYANLGQPRTIRLGLRYRRGPS